LATGWTPELWFVMPLEQSRGEVLATPWSGTVGVVLTALAGMALVVVTLPVLRWALGSRCGRRWDDASWRAQRNSVLWWLLALLPAIAVLLALGWWARPLGMQEHPERTWALLALLSLGQSLLGAVTGFLLFHLIAVAGTAALGREALGYGDVKLMGWVGALLGPVGVLLALGVAAVTGSVVGVAQRLAGGGREMPFGPWLALGAVVVLAAGPWLLALLLPS
jgi:prepilin signal peptidase PulO-like enzyme (type II secretory pathway)